MIIDKQAQFDWDAAITATAVSTLSYDLSAAGRELGFALSELWLILNVPVTAFTAAGAATFQVDWIDSAAAALSAPTVIRNIIPATGKATFAAGYLTKHRIPIEAFTQRYIGLQYTIATGPMTAGVLRAFLSPHVDSTKAYPKGYVNY